MYIYTHVKAPQGSWAPWCTELNGFCFDREIPIPIYKDNSCLLYDGSTHTSVSDLWNIYVDSGKQEHLAKMALGYLQKKFTNEEETLYE